MSPARRRLRMALILGIFIVAVFAAAATGWYYARVSAPATGPVVLISIDTLRPDHLPVYGYGKVETPAIDALAADGTVFEKAYAHSPLTLPSHVALLSGQLPFDTGVRDNAGFPVPPRLRLIPDVLGDRGWETAGVVSSFLLRGETGLSRAFDFYDSNLGRRGPAADPPPPLERPGTETFEVARRWMDGQVSERFFLFLHIHEPHAPYRPPERFSSYEPYDGEIAAADEIVSRLTAYLAGRGWYEAATIVLVSDHGESLGEHGESEHGLLLYDATIRVPLIVKLPGRAGAGRRISTPVQHVDLAPTIYDWLGAPKPPGLDGRSLRRLLDRGSDPLPEEVFYSESLYAHYHFGWSELYALTGSRFRYVQAPEPELYDLESDPADLDNVAPADEATVARMRGALAELGNRSVPAPGHVGEADAQRFQSLGYFFFSRPARPPETEPATLSDPKDRVAASEAFRRAVALGAGGKRDEAVRILTDQVRHNPGMKVAWLQLAQLHVQAGHLEEGLKCARAASALDPGDLHAGLAVAAVLKAMGRLDEAVETAGSAFASARPDDAAGRLAALESLVEMALARKSHEAARRYAAAAAETDPSFPLARYVEGRIHFEEGRFEQSLAAFEQVARAIEERGVGGPEITGISSDIGETLVGLGRDAEAELAFRKELEAFPGHGRPRAGLAALYWRQGRQADAERAVSQLLASAPPHEAYPLAIRLWTSLGEPARADALRAEARRHAVGRARTGIAGADDAREKR
ncbi:MAG: sulfatase-like hydrolase/transferase [Vicinamibacterales bacterium]